MSTQFFRTGAFATDTATDIITLWGFVTATQNVSTLRKVGATSGYQVTSGKTFYICRMKLFMTSNVVVQVPLGYADNDVGMDTTTARTNPVAVFGNPEVSNGTGGLSGLGSVSIAQTSNDDLSLHDIILPVAAATKYFYVRPNGTVNLSWTFIMSGFEL